MGPFESRVEQTFSEGRGADFHFDHTDFRIGPARYATGKVSVTPKDGRDGFKGQVSHLADALGMKWTHRDGGYVGSVSQAKKMMALLDAGWSGGMFGGFYPPESDREGISKAHGTPAAEEIRSQVLAQAKKLGIKSQDIKW